MPEDKIKERVTHHAKVMRIDHLLQRPIQALSNGQRQRDGIGPRTRCATPMSSCSMNPLSHLDAKLRHSMRAELKEMRTQLGTTTIYVTHDYLEAMSLGDRVAVLNEGHLLQLASPDDVYFRPASIDVAKFFGDPEVNIFDATLKTSGGSQISVQMLGENIPLALPGCGSNPEREAYEQDSGGSAPAGCSDRSGGRQAGISRHHLQLRTIRDQIDSYPQGSGWQFPKSSC